MSLLTRVVYLQNGSKHKHFSLAYDANSPSFKYMNQSSISAEEIEFFLKLKTKGD